MERLYGSDGSISSIDGKGTMFPWTPWKPMKNEGFTVLHPQHLGELTPKNEGFPWVPMVEGNFCRNPGEAGFCHVFQCEWMEKKDQSPIGLNIWFGEIMSCT